MCKSVHSAFGGGQCLNRPKSTTVNWGALQVHGLSTPLQAVQAKQLHLCEPGADQLIPPKCVQARAQCAWRWAVLELSEEHKSQLGGPTGTWFGHHAMGSGSRDSFFCASRERQADPSKICASPCTVCLEVGSARVARRVQEPIRGPIGACL